MSAIYTISDLVTLDQQAEFRNDVQLAAYEDPVRNLGLLHSYLFSHSAPDQGTAAIKTIAATGMLREIAESFINEKLKNRMVAIADYGHGKSHLALALANYFAKPIDSAETKLILDKLTHSIDEPAKASYFRAFKETKGNFLVIRLRGDLLESLYAQFFSGLQKALQEYPSTQADTLPFWYEEADRILRELQPEQVSAANRYLEDHHHDVASLRKRIQAHHDVHALAVGAIHAATNVKPDLLQVSLNKAIDWAVRQYVGYDKPFGGILILFDEFTLYILKHAERNAAGELQDLLNGAENHPGKVIFLGFAQDDPLNIADSVSMGNTARSNLKHELNRLEIKYRLYSLMESVINAYLKQSESVWRQLLHDKQFGRWVAEATDVAHERFRSRYVRDLHWPTERFQETVTKGCFPLHPITTALLSNLRFQAGTDLGAPRTVLGFILDELNDKQDEPITVDGRPNWVLPINVVDYFGKRVSEEFFPAFDNAVRQLGADIRDDQWAVLQALLLHEAANVGARGADQTAFLAQCAGFETSATKRILEELHEQSIIRFAQRVYSFWPSSNDPAKMERLIRSKLVRMPYNGVMLDRLNKDLAEKMVGSGFGSKDIEVSWGHQTDWAIHEELVTTDVSLQELLESHVQQMRIDSRGTHEGSRGYLFWLVARTDVEVTTLREAAGKVLDKALEGDRPYPVILVLPEQPTLQITELHRRLCALLNFDSAEQIDVGQEMYAHEVEKTTNDLVDEVGRLRGGTAHAFDLPRSLQNIVVPSVYRGQISALPPKSELRRVIQECYRMAYPLSPPIFFTQYRVSTPGANKLKIATKNVANLLLHNTTSTLKMSVNSDGVGRDLVDKYLIKDWGIVGPDQSIRLPTNHRIQAAWTLLDNTFVAGGKEVPLRTAFTKLLNPPYGYDYNTALLVFAAWFGYNGNDLRVFLDSRQSSHDSLSKLLDKGAKDFIDKAAGLFSGALARRKPGEGEEEVRKLMLKVQRSLFSQVEAEETIAKLTDYASDPRNNADLMRDADRAAKDLVAALDSAREYDRRAIALEKTLKTAPKLRAVVDLYKSLKEFPTLGKVSATTPKLHELQKSVLDRLADAIELLCAKNERLTDLTNSGLQRQYLISDRKGLVDAGLGEYVHRFDTALEHLEAEAERLTKLNQETPIRESIKAMSTEAQLKVLYESCERLESFTGYSQQTMTLRDHKLNLMRQKIEELERSARSMFERLADVDSRTASQTLLRHVLQSTYRYQGTPFEAELKQLQSRLESVSEFFDEASRIASTRYQSPAEVDKAIASLQGLSRRFAEVLSEDQLQIVEDVRQRVETQAEERTLQALQWLQSCEQELNNGLSLSEIKRKLAIVPAFFPDAEQPRLETIRQKVQARVDADAIASIEDAFRQIADRTQQEECLLRLQRILEAAPRVEATSH